MSTCSFLHLLDIVLLDVTAAFKAKLIDMLIMKYLAFKVIFVTSHSSALTQITIIDTGQIPTANPDGDKHRANLVRKVVQGGKSSPLPARPASKPTYREKFVPPKMSMVKFLSGLGWECVNYFVLIYFALFCMRIMFLC